MRHQIRLFNFHFKVLIIQNTIKVTILPNITKFWWVHFEKSSSVYHCFFRSHVCLSNLKHAPSRELPLTARKTVFSHLNTVKPCFTDTCLKRTRHYYGQFSLSLGKESLRISLNSTRLIRTARQKGNLWWRHRLWFFLISIRLNS